MQVAITGSSGLIGSELRRALDLSGHDVLRIVRGGPASPDAIRWDPMAGAIDTTGLEGIDAVVHLAGESIGGARWSETQKAKILDSRVHGTTLLARTLASLSAPPSIFVSGSAIGYYGNGREEILTEDSPKGGGFLADVVGRWEASTAAAAGAGIRVVRARSGIVLSRHGGALGRMLLPFRLGLGGRLGSGRQFWSWISIHDEVGAILHAIENKDLSGPVNMVAPHPVTQSEFATTLARVLGRPAVLPTPVFAVKAVYGDQMVEETLLWGQRVAPTKLEASGYHFLHPTLDVALRSLMSETA
jgi:uncharacterized protein (TIGR01777 family)